MVKYSIKIFARIRPTKKTIGVYEIGEEKDSTPSLSFIIPRLESSGLVNNKREVFSFRFNKIFNQQSKQNEVFEQVAQPVINNCLEGYNGTIFAYGQTSSGKTFTITGGAEKYSDRGVIPRTLSYLFEQYQKSPDIIFTTHISYLEIYNENGFDLLDPKHEASKLEDLPKVSLYEDSEGIISLKNLSFHQAANEEEALNWLFLGDTNRMIAETPMNMASTRSHCIFTIHISCRESGSHTVRKAKLHLVDLAGSERVAKSGVGGTLLTEAKYINLSLHYLEQVIVALSEKSRSHIPYRNSMMTSVLRDSLGGNCMTTMIATLSVEKRNIEESISTCRFAQRVALIKNEATLNEELDPKLVVARLQQQVADLKQEIVMATGEERTDELTNDEKTSVEQTVISYINDVNVDSRLMLGPDMRKIQLGFCIMKRMILDKSHSVSPSESHQKEKRIETPPSSNEDLIKLQDRLKQRDDEINVLLKMLKQERKKVAQTEALTKGVIQSRPVTPILGRTSPIHGLLREDVSSPNDSGCSSIDTRGVSVSSNNEDLMIGAKRNVIRAELSQARQEAFDMYRREIVDNSVMEEHKKVLKSKYAEAKLLGDKVNTTRLYINKLKTQVEKYRISQGLISGGVSSDEEERIRKEMEVEKKKFKELYNQLKTLKTEIEHVQHLMEKSKVQLQRDFEVWWTQQSSSNGRHSTVSSSQDSTLFPSLPSSSSSTHKRYNVLLTSTNNDTIETRPISQTRWKHREMLKLVKPVSQAIPLTGDMRADADIIAFYKARQKLISRSQE